MCKRDVGMENVTFFKSSHFGATEPLHKDEDLYPILPDHFKQGYPGRKNSRTSFSFDVASSKTGKLFDGCDDYGPFFKFKKERKEKRKIYIGQRRQNFSFS